MSETVVYDDGCKQFLKNRSRTILKLSYRGNSKKCEISSNRGREKVSSAYHDETRSNEMFCIALK